jgi:hypothetical protein
LGRLTLAGLLLWLLACAPAQAAHWSRPATVDTSTAQIGSFVFGSDGGNFFYLDEFRYPGRRNELFRLKPDGSFARRSLKLPPRPGFGFPSIDLNDRGDLVFGWTAPAPDPSGKHDGDSCWCTVRTMFRRPSGRLTRPQTIARAAPGQDGPIVVLDKRGGTTAAWVSESSSSSVLRVARAAPGRRFRAARKVESQADGFDLFSIGEVPVLEWNRDPAGSVFESRAPFQRRHRIGRGAPFPDGEHPNVAIARDGRGNELRIRVGPHVETSFRRAGGAFSRPRRIASLFPAAVGCEVVARLKSGGAFAAWTCARSLGDSPFGFGRAALMSRHGRLLRLSREHSAVARQTPGLDFDEHGRGVAAWQSTDFRGYYSLVAAHRRFGRRLPIATTAEQDESPVDVAFAANGRAYATWIDRALRKRRVRVSSLRLPR